MLLDQLLKIMTFLILNLEIFWACARPSWNSPLTHQAWLVWSENQSKSDKVDQLTSFGGWSPSPRWPSPACFFGFVQSFLSERPFGIDCDSDGCYQFPPKISDLRQGLTQASVLDSTTAAAPHWGLGRCSEVGHPPIASRSSGARRSRLPESRWLMMVTLSRVCGSLFGWDKATKMICWC